MSGGCQRCDGGGNCLSAPCNMDCRNLGNGQCETIIMGGGGDVPPEGGGNYAKEMKEKLAAFYQAYKVDRCTELMTQAGINVGDWVTHVNGKFPNSLDEFGEMVKHLPEGTVFKVWKGSERVDITL
jgi:hypothetical protein